MSDQLNTQQLFEFFNEIGIISQLGGTRFSQYLPGRLTSPQFFVLNNFVRLGGTRSPKQLADAFQVTKGAMTNTLSHLERAGYVEIKADPDDGRAKIVSITAAGVTARNQAIQAVAPAFKDVGQILSEHDRSEERR